MSIGDWAPEPTYQPPTSTKQTRMERIEEKLDLLLSKLDNLEKEQ